MKGNAVMSDSRTGIRVLGDPFYGAYELKLSDLVDQVDVVEALCAIEVALMHGVDAQKARAALWMGLAPLADGDAHWTGLVPCDTPPPVSLGVAQVIEVAVGDGGQPLITGIAE